MRGAVACSETDFGPAEPVGRSQTRPVEVLRTRRHMGRRHSFLTVGLAITDFINFTTIIYRVSAMDLEIEPMGPKIRLWPCGARRA